MDFRYSINASFVLIAKNLFHYMAESSGSLVASQGSHAECGCERAFQLILILSLENISLLETDIAVPLKG